VLKIARSSRKTSPRLIPNDPDAEDRVRNQSAHPWHLRRVRAIWVRAGLPDHLWPAVRDHDLDLGLRVTSFVDPQLAVAQSQGGAVLLVSHVVFASPEEALTLYLNSTAGWVQTAMAVVDLAAIGWIWFVVGLGLLLGRAEGSPPWRSAVALVSGVILGAFLLLNTSSNAASFGATDLDRAVASYAFDVSTLGFANA
jgi:hypothetical protein